MRNRNYAIEYLNLTINKKLTKTDFCRSNNISINSLNKGLESLGVKIKSKKKNNDEGCLNTQPMSETNIRKRNKRIKHATRSEKKQESKGGYTLNEAEIDKPLNEEADDLINNALNNF